MELAVLSNSEIPSVDLPSRTRLVDLGIGPLEHRLKYLLRLTMQLSNYFRESNPDIVLSQLPAANAFSVIAKILSGRAIHLILAEHTLPLDRLFQIERKLSRGSHKSSTLLTLVPSLMRYLYPIAQCIVAVSSGIAKELEEDKKIRSDKIQVIYNPVVNQELLDQARLPIEHPWFKADQPPVILAVGRLEMQKDYQTLIHAFRDLRDRQEVHLLILGEGSSRSHLESLVKELKLENDVSLPGFVENPYAYMSHSKVMVLSSIWEVLPTVLIEALACGCPIVSTDCEHGPSEILEGGKYGWLVPVSDKIALANAMKNALEATEDYKSSLLHRARDFTVEKSVSSYLKIMHLEGL